MERNLKKREKIAVFFVLTLISVQGVFACVNLSLTPEKLAAPQLNQGDRISAFLGKSAGKLTGRGGEMGKRILYSREAAKFCFVENEDF